MELNTVYFYTVAIVDWIPLLSSDKYKRIIIDSLIYLVNKNKIKVYAFVIMPNHIHLIWECIELNGKEMPYVSFMKFTGHKFLTELRQSNTSFIETFEIKAIDRDHKFWQRGALPIKMYSRKIVEQKLDYIHLNPMQEHWNLVTDPNDYYYSSCSFYEKEDQRFGWLTHYMNEF